MEDIYTNRLFNFDNDHPKLENSDELTDQSSEPKNSSQIDIISQSKINENVILIQEELKNIINDSNVLNIFFGSKDAIVDNPNLYVVVDRIPTKPLQMVGIFPIVYIEWRKFTEVGPKNFPPSKPLPLNVKEKFNDILDTELGLEFRSKFFNLTAIRLDWKIVDGFYIEKPAIVFYVIRKGIIPIGNEFFPKIINGIETDVCEGFYEKTTCLYSGDCREYKDIVSPGCSIGISGTTLVGTLGAFVKDQNKQNNNIYLLTNDHVIRSNVEKTICQPAKDDHIDFYKKNLDHFKKELDKLEKLEFETEIVRKRKEDAKNDIKKFEKKLNKAEKNTQFASFEKGFRGNFEIDKKNYGVDAAIASLDQNLRNIEPNCFAIRGLAFEEMFEKEEVKDPIELSGFKNIKEVGSVDNSMPIFKVGRTTGLTQGYIIEDQTVVRDLNGKLLLERQVPSIFYGVLIDKTKIHEDIWLDRQILVRGQRNETFMDEGDSGCVWFDRNGEAIALGHGTLSIPRGVCAIGSPIVAVFKALEVDLIVDVEQIDQSSESKDPLQITKIIQAELPPQIIHSFPSSEISENNQSSEPKNLSQNDIISQSKINENVILIQEELKSIINDSNVLNIFFGSKDAIVDNPNLYVVVDRIPTKPLQMVGIFPIVYIEWRKFTEVGPKNFPPSKSLPLDVKEKFDNILDTELGLEFRSKFINLTAIRLDWKIVNGFYTERPAIVFYVIRKGIIPIGNEFFPKIINGIETDVCEGFYEKTTCLYSGDCREYKDFVSPGCSIGISDTTLAGTLGAFVKDQNNKKYLLTNDHAIRSNVQKTIRQPAEDDYIVPLKRILALYEKKLNDLEKDVIKKESYELKKKEFMKKKDEYEKKLEEAKEKNTKFASFEKGLRCNVCNVCNVEIDKKDYGCNVETHKKYGVDAAIALLDQNPRSINVEPNCFAISDLAFEKMFEKEEKKDPIKLSGFKNINEVGLVDDSMPIFKVGRTTGLTQGYIIEDQTVVRDLNGKLLLERQVPSIFYGALMDKTKIHEDIWLDRQILVRGQRNETFMDEGDSGCVWFDRKGEAIALGHGTLSIPRGVCAIGSPISVVLKALEIDLIFDLE